MIVEHRHEMGEGGYCICPKYEEKIPHSKCVPCQDECCPKCGAKMLREGSYHHDLLEKKMAKKRNKEG